MRTDFTPRLQYTLAVVGIAGGVASLGFSAAKYFGSKHQDKMAQAEGNALKRPFEKISDEYFQDKNIAEEQAAGGGLPIDTQNYLQSKRDQQLGSSFDALKQGGASVNEFGRLNKLFDESLLSEGSLMAQEKHKNIQDLMTYNKDLAGQKTTQWTVNEYQPFESKLKEIQDRRIAAKQSEDAAIEQGIGSLTSIGTSLASQYSSGTGFFKTKTPAPASGSGGASTDMG